MPDLDVIFPEGSRKWKWMISDEDLEELEELEEKYGKEED